MAAFPLLEPYRRSYDLGLFAVRSEEAFGAGPIMRYRYGTTDETGQQLSLEYILLTEAELQQIRDHYNAQLGGTVAFDLPSIIWQGHTTQVFPAGVQWRYASPPEETHATGSRYDVTVQLESVLH